MLNEKQLRTCRVCGYLFTGFQPWGDDGETASFSYCPCCFTEFGFDDIRTELIREKRRQWIDKGYLWYEINKKPADWNPREQLKNIPKQFLDPGESY
jgi:hypothetical protein